MSESYTFGNKPEFQATYINAEKGELSSDKISIERSHSLDTDLYHAALEDIQETWKIVEDKKTGATFEIAIANTQGDKEKGYDMEISTFSSALSNNSGNAKEFAENAAINSQKPRIYLASPGNGGSSYWTPAEEKHLKETGRFVDSDGKPLPTIAALARVMTQLELDVTRLSSNSAGGAITTAFMNALPEGQVTHSYIKSRPNISNHQFSTLWGLNLQLSDALVDDRNYKKHSSDARRMTPTLEEEAREAIPKLYGDGNGYWSISDTSKTRGLHQLRANAVIYSRGGKKYDHPAVHDTAAALNKQPEAEVTFHFPHQDKLYVKSETLIFMQQIASRGLKAQSLLMPGKHRDHTQYPTLRWSVENYAFKR